LDCAGTHITGIRDECRAEIEENRGAETEKTTLALDHQPPVAVARLRSMECDPRLVPHHSRRLEIDFLEIHADVTVESLVASRTFGDDSFALNVLDEALCIDSDGKRDELFQ